VLTASLCVSGALWGEHPGSQHPTTVEEPTRHSHLTLPLRMSPGGLVPVLVFFLLL
jgi:hypothetical protein